MIALTVIGGYLGAGKTTLLNHLLAHTDGRGIGLLINDFGEINIDAHLIESKTDNQINLTNGCVCCTLVDGFHVAMDQLSEIRPPLSRIIIEASGVADVHNLAQYGYGPGWQLDAVLVLADAETITARAEDKYVGRTVRRQLEAADLIILNKTDLVSAEHLSKVRGWLSGEYPNVRIVDTTRALVPLPLLLGIHDFYRASEHAHVAHAAYSTWKFTTPGAVSKASLDGFLAALGEGVLRLKGLAQLDTGECVTIQVVGSRIEVAPAGSAPTGCQLVAIGLEGAVETERIDALAASILGAAPDS